MEKNPGYVRYVYTYNYVVISSAAYYRTSACIHVTFSSAAYHLLCIEQCCCDVTEADFLPVNIDITTLHEMVKISISTPVCMNELALFAQEGRRYSVRGNDLPVWGKHEVYRSRKAALTSLRSDDTRVQYVGLLHVANNEQLKTMLSARDVCGPIDELYLRLDSTCPLFNAIWNPSENDARVELESSVPLDGSRGELLRPFT